MLFHIWYASANIHEMYIECGISVSVFFLVELKYIEMIYKIA